MSLWLENQGSGWLAWATLAALLSGCCPEIRPSGPGPEEIARNAEVAEALHLASRLGTLPHNELQADLATTSQRVELHGKPADKLRLALLLARPGAPFEEVLKARALLVGVANDEAVKQAEPVWSDFATYQLKVIEGRLWQKGELRRLRQLKEEERQQREEERQQREVLEQQKDTLEQQKDTLEQQKGTLEQQKDTLEQKLEAVKAIEKKIDERAPTRSVPPPAVPPPRNK